MDMSKYMAMFISETAEHLQMMNKGLVQIEQDPKDSEAIAEVFRNAHSIKGMAASMGFEPIRDLSHAMEDLMDGIREGNRSPEPDVMDVLFKGLDTLENMLKDVEQEKESSGSWQEISQTIRQILQKEEQKESAADNYVAADHTNEADIIVDENPEEETEQDDSAAPVKRLNAELDFGSDDFFMSGPDAPEKELVRDSISISRSVPSPMPTLEDIQNKSTSALPETVPPSKSKSPDTPKFEPVMSVENEMDFSRDDGGDDFDDEVSFSLEDGGFTRVPSSQTQAQEDEKPVLEEASQQAIEEKKSKPNKTVKVIFSPQTISPAVRGLILFKRIGEGGEIIGSRPPLDEVKTGTFLPDPEGLAVEVDIIQETSDEELGKLINSVTDVQSFEIMEPSVPETDDAEEIKEETPPEQEEIIQTEQSYDPFAQVQTLPQTVRVKTSALDKFIYSLGEMILVKNELREVAKSRPSSLLDHGLDKLDSLIKEFHGQIMSIRMMPLEGVVQRLPRVVRDLVKDEGKKARFEIIGQDIELDRAILEQLSDPLIHLLRNSVNHGLETPEERKMKGKDEEGKIILEAYRERDMVLIEIRDDGRGMDPFQLKDIAVAKGVISHEEADKMSDQDAYQLIFAPGFSTAKEVGMISGRGVGMDAVKNMIEGVSGYVTVDTTLGKGSTFTLHIPRTIAIVNVMLVDLAGEAFAIPVTKVLKTVKIMPHQIRANQGQRYFLDRQEMVPLKPLHRFLDLEEPEDPPRGVPINALIVESHNRKNALIVDDLVGQEEAFIRPLGKPLERISGLSGVTMLGNGKMVFVLDTMSLL
jgi:two-component system, chemotaxis family, sensor kinase CheA